MKGRTLTREASPQEYPRKGKEDGVKVLHEGGGVRGRTEKDQAAGG